MLLRQVQARPLQGHRLRALRRRGHALQGAPRAHGPHRPGRPGQPHLVLQGRPEPHRLPARHGAEGAREGPVLRRVDRHVGRRGGALARPPDLEAQMQAELDRYAAEREERVVELRESLDARVGVPRERRPERLRRRGPPVGRERSTSTSRSSPTTSARSSSKDVKKTLRGGHRRHRGVQRGRPERLREVWELFANKDEPSDDPPAEGEEWPLSSFTEKPIEKDDSAQEDRRRRDALPRAQGALRLARTASASTSAAAWAPSRSATCSEQVDLEAEPRRSRRCRRPAGTAGIVEHERVELEDLVKTARARSRPARSSA